MDVIPRVFRGMLWRSGMGESVIERIEEYQYVYLLYDDYRLFSRANASRCHRQCLAPWIPTHGGGMYRRAILARLASGARGLGSPRHRR
jgi:hypothetical protein